MVDIKLVTAFTVLGSAFGIIASAFYNFHHLSLGLLSAVFALISLSATILVDFNNGKNAKTEKINIKEFTFVNPQGYYTHPKYPYPLCPSCLIRNKLTSPVSNGFCTVCKEPISETLVSGGDVFRIPYD